jgi:hypothetical protein
MDTFQQATVIPKDREASGGSQRQRRSIAEKRRMVEETLAPEVVQKCCGSSKPRARVEIKSLQKSMITGAAI